jgi:hypothetical protein
LHLRIEAGVIGSSVRYRSTADSELVEPLAFVDSKSMGGLISAQAAAPQRNDQVPCFYRVKVGNFEVTARFDGNGTFQKELMTGKKSTLDGVLNELHEHPHMLDGAETGLLNQHWKTAYRRRDAAASISTLTANEPAFSVTPNCKV